MALPDQVEDWTKFHVYDWAKTIIAEEEAIKFKIAATDGNDLLTFSLQEFAEIVEIPKAPAYKIQKAIQQLQKNTQQNQDRTQQPIQVATPVQRSESSRVTRPDLPPRARTINLTSSHHPRGYCTNISYLSRTKKTKF